MIKNSRGKPIIEQLEILLNMIECNPVKLAESMEPIITKVNPKDEEFDIETFRSDLGETIQEYLVIKKTELFGSMTSKESDDLDSEIEFFKNQEFFKIDNYQEKLEALERFCEIEKFFSIF